MRLNMAAKFLDIKDKLQVQVTCKIETVGAMICTVVIGLWCILQQKIMFSVQLSFYDLFATLFQAFNKIM